ncbi:MAG: PAS domain S-box protein [bacterium]|nr:PAS domain S-box protein [bacterium]
MRVLVFAQTGDNWADFELQIGEQFESVEVEVCDSPETILEEPRPTAVIADLDPTEVEQVQAIKQLQRNWPNLPVIALCSSGERSEVVRALVAGARAVIPKGDDQDQRILKALHSAIDTSVAVAEWGRGDRFRQVFESLPIALFLTLADGVLVGANSAFADLLGFDSVESILGVDAREFYVNPVERDEWLENVLADGRVEEFEVELRRLDGAKIWVRETSRVVWDNPDGTVIFQGMLEDINERRAAEEALRASELRYRTLFETAQDSIFLTHGDRFVECNSRTFEMFGCSPAEIISKRPDDFSPETQPDGRASREKAAERIEKALNGEPQFFEWQHSRANGSVFDAEVSLNRLELDVQEGCLLAVVRDITERRMAFEILQRRDSVFEALTFAAERCLRGKSWREAMPGVLERLARAVDVSRSCLFSRDSPSGRAMTVSEILEWTASDARPQLSNPLLQGFDPRKRGLERWMRILGKGKPVAANVSDLPHAEADFLRRFDVVSIAAFPVVVAGRTWGFLCFEDSRKEHDWTGSDIEALAAAADILAAALDFDRARMSLERSEEKYRDLVENIDDIICMLDLDGKVLDINHAAMTVLGHPREAVLGTSLVDIIATRYREELAPTLKAVQESGRASGMMRIVDAAGEERLIEYRSTLRTEGVEVPVIRAVARDVSHRWRAEQQLKQYSERLDALRAVDRAVLAGKSTEEVAAIAVEGIRKVVDCDRSSVVLFGSENEEAQILAVDQNGEIGPGPKIQRPTKELFDVAGLQEHPFLYTPDLLAEPNLLPIYQELMSHGVRSILNVRLQSGGTLLGTLNMGSRQAQAFAVHDIDVAQQFADELSLAFQQSRLAAAVDAAGARLEAIVEHLPNGVLLVGPQRHVLLANPVADQILSVLGVEDRNSLPEKIGVLEVSDLLCAEGREPVEILSEGTDPRFFEIVSREIGGDADQAWVIVLREVTDERRAEREQQLQQRLAAVGQLAAGIAHDFNNILQAVELNAELISYAQDSENAETRLDAIHEQADRGAALIRQILDFARKTVTHPHAVSLRQFLNDSIRLLERGIPENIELKVDIAEHDIEINADPAQLQQLLTNLVMNARDAMPDGGKLSIVLNELILGGEDQRPLPDMPDGRWMSLRVTDSGAGVPPELRDRIFEPFFTTKEPGQGTGLGLAQVYGIVKQHRGFVDLTGNDSEGTTFVVYLPLADEATSPLPWVEDSLLEDVPKGHGQLVLVAEDDPAVLEIAKAGLETLGYRVLTACDGEKALELCSQHGRELQLVLSDMVMPGIGGVELARQLRERNLPMGVLLMSGYPLDASRTDSIDVSDWLQKPFSMDELACAVALALKR